MLLLRSFIHGAWVLLSLCPHCAICAVHGRSMELAGGGLAELLKDGGVRGVRKRR
jgi:hypothetical protein